MMSVIENFSDFLVDYGKMEHFNGETEAQLSVARARAPYNNVTKSKGRKFRPTVFHHFPRVRRFISLPTILELLDR